MPIGTIIFVDFWMSRRLGFHRAYAGRAGGSVNWFVSLPGLVHRRAQLHRC